MTLVLSQRADPGINLDLEGITPERFREKSLAEIERTEVGLGNRRVPLAELFRASGDPTGGRIELAGQLAVDHIGAGMSVGEIIVQGDAGRHLGAGMSGGMIRVTGDAGIWAGAEMRGGLIRIEGSAGHGAGSAYPGGRRGMMGGTILIGGSAGEGVGRSLRRGMLAIGGDCGDLAGFGMIAGTILIFGACGGRVGAEMRRGTIGLFGPGPPPMLPTFRRAGRFRPLFLRLIAAELARLGFPTPEGLFDDELSLYHGDLLSLGKGEVWIRERDGAR